MMPGSPLPPLLEFLLGYVAGRLLDGALKQGVTYAGDVWQKFSALRLRPGFVKRTTLVNRERELRAIRKAIQDAPHLRIIYFSGPSGIGKTRLLEEAGRMVQRIYSSTPLGWSGVLDLYHADLHSVAALQTALVQNLDPTSKYFQRYREARARFELRRSAGVEGLILDTEREALNRLFSEEYIAFANQRRLVVALDTAESLGHESDIIQVLCRIEDASDVVQSWLLQQAEHLQNTTLLIAGRPQPPFQELLAKRYADKPGQYEAFELAELSREDSRRLLALLLKSTSPDLRWLQEHADRLWQLTQGRPVHLALAIELAAQSHAFVAPATANQILDMATWGRYLVSTLFNRTEEESRIFFFLVLARKGLDTDLLRYLEPSWSITECVQRLSKVRNLSIVKTRPGREELFLHEALYELFDTYSLPDKELQPWRERIASYHRVRQSLMGNDRVLWTQATVNLFYYELELDPWRAFESCYLHWDEVAIKGYEVGLDMQLRDELLRFWHSELNRQRTTDYEPLRTRIDLDSAVRWVKRFLMRQQRVMAIQVAETILALGPEPYSLLPSDVAIKLASLPEPQRTQGRSLVAKGGDFFWGHLLTYYGEALAYTSAPEPQVRRILEFAQRLLESAEEEASSSWLRRRVSGRAANTLGYLFRMHGRYGRALAAYERALHYFAVPDSADERADTLNNLAFVLALLGDNQKAKEVIDKALDIRQQHGQPYPLALSHNTRGLIYLLQGEFEAARRECEWALLNFEEMEELRGIGLACIALGLIMRQQGKAVLESGLEYEQASILFGRGARFLERAIGIFAEQIIEPLRLWEAHNELGSLLRDWGSSLQRQTDHDTAQARFEEAVKSYQQALDTAQAYGLHFQEADTCDDLAYAWALRGNMEMARHWLERTLSLIPHSFTLNADGDSAELPESGEAYWLILGKVHWQQCLWFLSTLEQNLSKRQRTKAVKEAMQHLVQAYAYFERYWTDAPALRLRFQRLVPHIVQADLANAKTRYLLNKLASQKGVEPRRLWHLIGGADNTKSSLARS